MPIIPQNIYVITTATADIIKFDILDGSFQLQYINPFVVVPLLLIDAAIAARASVTLSTILIKVL